MDFLHEIEFALDENERAFRVAHLKKLDVLSAALNQTKQSLDRIGCVVMSIVPDEGADHSRPETIYFILCNVMADLISVYTNLRQGFVRPAACTIRGVLENLAVAMYLQRSVKAYNAFCKGRGFSPSLAIRSVSKYLPLIDRMIRRLSRDFVHETFQSVGRGLSESGEFLILPVVPTYASSKEHILTLFALLIQTLEILRGVSEVIAEEIQKDDAKNR